MSLSANKKDMVLVHTQECLYTFLAKHLSKKILANFTNMQKLELNHSTEAEI